MTMEVEIHINEHINVDVTIADIIDAINEWPMAKRWVYISHIINGVALNIDDLTEEQREIIINYLESKILMFKPV